MRGVVFLGNRQVEVAAGEGHTVARRSDGTAWGWGRNDYGQLTTPDPAYVYKVQALQPGQTCEG